MCPVGFQRTVPVRSADIGGRFSALHDFISRCASISISRAPVAFKPPTVAGFELLNVLHERNEAGSAIEFFGASDAEQDDEERERAMGLKRRRFEQTESLEDQFSEFAEEMRRQLATHFSNQACRREGVDL